MRVQAQRLAERNVIAAKVIDLRVEDDAEGSGGASQVGIRACGAAPAAITSVDEFGDLSKLALR